MNTSKEAAKAAEKKTALKPGELPEDLQNEGLTAEEIAAMNNIQPPAKVEENSIDTIFDALESKDTNFTELTANYIEFKDFKEGEERAYICTGKTNFTTKDGEVKPAVTLIDRARNTWICASTVVVNSLFKVEKFPVGCKIKVSGKVKGANGEYYKAQVFIL